MRRVLGLRLERSICSHKLDDLIVLLLDDRVFFLKLRVFFLELLAQRLAELFKLFYARQSTIQTSNKTFQYKKNVQISSFKLVADSLVFCRLRDGAPSLSVDIIIVN